MASFTKRVSLATPLIAALGIASAKAEATRPYPALLSPKSERLPTKLASAFKITF